MHEHAVGLVLDVAESIERWAKVSSTPSEPPPSPNMALNVFVPKTQLWSSLPRLPKGS
jgi:hypothetical protein